MGRRVAGKMVIRRCWKRGIRLVMGAASGRRDARATGRKAERKAVEGARMAAML